MIGRLGRSLGRAPAAGLAAPGGGPAARAGDAPVVPDRSADVLGAGVARGARRPGRLRAAAAPGARLPEVGPDHDDPVQGRVRVRAAVPARVRRSAATRAASCQGILPFTARRCLQLDVPVDEPEPEPAAERRGDQQSLLDVAVDAAGRPRARRRTRCGCRRSTCRPPSTSCCPASAVDPERGLVSHGLARARRPRRARRRRGQAVRAAPRPAVGRPVRRRRSRRGRRRSAERQVHDAAHRSSRRSRSPTPRRRAVLLPRLRRRRPSPGWPGCRTSAASAPGSTPTGAPDGRRGGRLVDRREKCFRANGIDSMATYRRGGRAGAPTTPYGDVFLVVDGWGTLRQEFEDLEPEIQQIAARGLSFGVHLVAAASRWAEVRPAVRDLVGTRLELRLGDPMESVIDRRARRRCRSPPGRGLTRQAALPGRAAAHRRRCRADTSATAWRLVRRVTRPGRAARPQGAAAAAAVPLDEVARPAPARCRRRRACSIGINESALAPVYLDLVNEPHLTVFGDAECGKTILRGWPAASRPGAGRPGWSSSTTGARCSARSREHLLDYAPSTRRSGAARPRAPETGCPGRTSPPSSCATGAGGRGRSSTSWSTTTTWSPPGSNPLARCTSCCPQARDIGLHLIIARRRAAWPGRCTSRSCNRLRELASPAC